MTEPEAHSRPFVSESLKSAMMALEDFWNSGGAPVYSGSGIGSLESRAESGKYGARTETVWEEIRDPYRGVKVNDSFEKLTHPQQTCLRTHFFWSAWTPLYRERETPWAEVLTEEAAHAAMDEPLYETVLKSAIAEMERACI